MGRKKQRGEIRRRRKRESKRNWEERQNRERRMQEFIEDDSSKGDIYGWQDAQDFDTETSDSWVDSDSGVILSSSMSEEEQNALREMGLDYNRSSDEKRFGTLSEKYGSDENPFTWDNYDLITSILGSDLYLVLREANYLDSAQIIDEILSFNENVKPEDVERALLSMISDINRIEESNVNTLLEAMDLGFSLDEAIELTEIDIIENLIPEQGISDLRDRIMYEVERTELRRQLEQRLREQGEQLRIK